ncbi:MAG: DUF952 domain-containing protein [Myxococcaceae bacterium]
MSLFHVATESEWTAGQADGRYLPARFGADGFVHCCGDRAAALQVVAAYYAHVTTGLMLVTLDEAKLDVPLKWEAPAPPDGQAHAHHEPGRRFPHVYGSIPLTAVTAVERLR